jgi:hypothetical protein
VSVYNVPFPLRCILDAVLTKSADLPLPAGRVDFGASGRTRRPGNRCRRLSKSRLAGRGSPALRR